MTSEQLDKIIERIHATKTPAQLENTRKALEYIKNMPKITLEEAEAQQRRNSKD